MNAEIKLMPLVNENATNILVREMGVVDTIRFLNQFSVGYGNYTEERRKIYFKRSGFRFFQKTIGISMSLKFAYSL